MAKTKRTDQDLLAWAIMHAGNDADNSDGLRSRWWHVSVLFGLGSTHAKALCERFTVDPDEIVGARDGGQA